MNSKKHDLEKNLKNFCLYMNKKAHELGMIDSVFNDPAGIENYSTARDILMCLLEASNTEVISEIWSQKSDSISIKGKNARIMDFTSKTLMGVNSENLCNYYKVFGGKGGTLNRPRIYNSAVIVQTPDNKEQLACVIMKANDSNEGSENRFVAAKQAIDAAMKVYNQQIGIVKDVCAESAIVCIADGNSWDELKILYEKNPQNIIKPASLSKMLTAIVTLEFIENIQTEVCVTQEMLDMVPASFYQKDFMEGDIVTVRDLMSAMFLPSSNAAAYILGCVIGEKIQ